MTVVRWNDVLVPSASFPHHFCWNNPPFIFWSVMDISFRILLVTRQKVVYKTIMIGMKVFVTISKWLKAHLFSPLIPLSLFHLSWSSRIVTMLTVYFHANLAWIDTCVSRLAGVVWRQECLVGSAHFLRGAVPATARQEVHAPGRPRTEGGKCCAHLVLSALSCHVLLLLSF